MKDMFVNKAPDRVFAYAVNITHRLNSRKEDIRITRKGDYWLIERDRGIIRFLSPTAKLMGISMKSFEKSLNDSSK